MTAKRRFSDAERWAVFTAYGQHCYLCRRPIDFRSMQVDHVIPEELLAHPTELKDVLANLGLPATFDLNAFGNWLPSCGPCNSKKSTARFEPSLMLQLELQRARELASKAEGLARATVSNRQIGNAFAALQRASANNQIDACELAPLVSDFLRAHPDVARLLQDEFSHTKLAFMVEPEPLLELRLAENAKFVFSDQGINLVQGRHGVGYRTREPNPDSSFYCSNCGSLGPWNGSRCMSCGMMDCD